VREFLKRLLSHIEDLEHQLHYDHMGIGEIVWSDERNELKKQLDEGSCHLEVAERA
jgi:hypothetical protein